MSNKQSLKFKVKIGRSNSFQQICMKFKYFSLITIKIITIGQPIFPRRLHKLKKCSNEQLIIMIASIF
jgi:hypothetical protein